MTQNEKRIKIAERCGIDQWVIMKRGLYYRENGIGCTSCISEAWKLPKDEAKKHEYPHDTPVTIRAAPIPDYFNDLNAMHEAEKVLTSPLRYCELLIEECGESEDAEAYFSRFPVFHATATQRAEAFGKSMNLW